MVKVGEVNNNSNKRRYLGFCCTRKLRDCGTFCQWCIVKLRFTIGVVVDVIGLLGLELGLVFGLGSVCGFLSVNVNDLVEYSLSII